MDDSSSVAEDSLKQFRKFKHPPPPAYLGKVYTSCCGYFYDHCTTGTLFYGTYIALAMGIDLNDINQKYKKLLVSKQALCLESDGLESLLEMATKKSLDLKIKRTEDALKLFLTDKYPGLTVDTCQTWLDTLVSYTKTRPSNSHFMGIVQNLKGYECMLKPKIGSNPNPELRGAASGYWFERWPTEREVASLLLRSQKITFGVPPAPHRHGN